MRFPRSLRALRPFATPALAAALVGFAAPGARADDDRAATPEEVEQVTARLEGKGYSAVGDVEVDDGRFEVDAVNPEGEQVDVELDMETLEIVEERRD